MQTRRVGRGDGAGRCKWSACTSDYQALSRSKGNGEDQKEEMEASEQITRGGWRGKKKGASKESPTAE